MKKPTQIKPANAGKHWTSSEDQKLRQEVANKESTKVIATSHKRTPDAIEDRKEKLHITKPNKR